MAEVEAGSINRGRRDWADSAPCDCPAWGDWGTADSDSGRALVPG